MKVFPALEQLADYAAKHGHNRAEALEIIAKNYDYIKRVYPEASPRKIVNIAWVIY